MQKTTHLRLGAFALIVSSMLTLGGLLLRGPLMITVSDAEAFARAAVSQNNLIAEMFLPLSLVVQLFGFLGIYVYLERPGNRKAVYWGMVLSIFGNGLFLPFAGVFAFAMPIIGKLYLAGNYAVIHVAELTLGPGPGLFYLIASALALTAGGVLFASAIWRTESLPRWLAVIYLMQAFALSFGASLGYPFEVTGGILLAILSFFFAKRMWSA